MKKASDRMNEIYLDHQENKIKMDEIPSRKKIDLNIYEDNLKILKNQIKNQIEKKADFRKKFEQTIT